MLRASFSLTCALLLVGPCCAPAFAAEPDAAAGVEFFESRVRPLFVEHCYACHSSQAKRVEGGLRLDNPTAIRRGGDSGPIVSAGKPEVSSLIAAVTYAPDGANMPPKGKLNARAIADLTRWVSLGAPLPEEAPTAAAARPAVVIDAAARDYWAFRPVVEHAPPQIDDPRWTRTKIDYFLRSELDRRKIRPAPEADARTLCRRLYFDLVGLPPTAEEVEAFVRDSARPEAYAELVDKLLASPHYGERWARHWLDVARYGEDNPTSEATCKAPRFAYRYRDWVVQSLNDDLPYDDFLRRQLAADLMPELPPAERAATGFWGLSPVYHKEPKLSAQMISVIVADEWDERVDTLTRGLLGLTVACARCHDHKYDPIRTEDYYALAGVAASTRLAELPLADVPWNEALQLQAVRDDIVETELRLSYARTMSKTAKAAGKPTAVFDEQAKRLAAESEALKKTKLFDGPIASGVCDASLTVDGDDPDFTRLVYRPGESRDLPVFIRGNPLRTGETVPRRFLEVLSPGTPRPFAAGSGRRELAEAIVDEAGPLAARVIVNRVWGRHFGQSLVRTPSNFGKLGEPPSHPELLDDLAARFVQNGWSLKWLHREIVLSAAYRQASVHPWAGTDRDPAKTDGDNRLLWRMNRKRLEAEAYRDALLRTAGRLDPTVGGPSLDLNDAKNVRRTIYGKVSRQTNADLLRLFDFPDAKQHAEERLTTITPLQELYLLNSDFVQNQAAAIVAALEPKKPTVSKNAANKNAESKNSAARPSAATWVQALFRRTLQRGPTKAERAAALQLLDDRQLDPTTARRLVAHGILASNEFLHVD